MFAQNYTQTKKTSIIYLSEPNSPHLVITTYGLVGSDPANMLPPDYSGGSTKWDYVVLDEGHKIKNPSTKVNKGCRVICEGQDQSGQSTRRLLLTGTPFQNNLKEFWALFDWATSGQILGTQQSFNDRYACAIEDGRYKNALPSTIRIANAASKELQNLLWPYFLIQRMKETNVDYDFLTEKDTEGGICSPFSETPMGFTNTPVNETQDSRRSDAHDTAKNNWDNTVENEKRREKRNSITKRKPSDAYIIGVSDKENTPTDNELDCSAPLSLTSYQTEDNSNFLTKLETCVSKSEHLEKCLNHLFDLVESPCLDEVSKLKVHKSIARASNKLGWLFVKPCHVQ